jgi:hypothetical protein
VSAGQGQGPRPPVSARGPDAEPGPVVHGSNEPHSLVELVNRVIDRGVVLQGDVTISVAGVDLVYLGLNALLTSVSTARRTLDRPLLAPINPSSAPALPDPAAPGPAHLARAVGSLHSASGAVQDPRPPEPTPVGQPTVPDALAERLVTVAETLPERIDVDPEGVQRDLGRLVLTVVELLRQVVEHQAVQRMEDDDLTDEQVERMGLALQRLEEKMAEIKGVFGLADQDLNIDLGPLGKLL